MWGLKGVAWQPPPALRNGRHTRHTHTPSSFSRPPSSFRHADRSVLPQPPSPPSLTLGQDTVPPRIIHISRGGKFLNFARIENFHILFPWLVAYLAALLADLLSLSGPRCDSCDRIEKFPKPRSYLPIHSIVKKGLVIERNAARRFSRSRSRRFATNGEDVVAGNAQRFRCYSSSISNCNFTIGCKDVLPARLLEIHASGFLVQEFLVFLSTLFQVSFL